MRKTLLLFLLLGAALISGCAHNNQKIDAPDNTVIVEPFIKKDDFSGATYWGCTFKNYKGMMKVTATGGIDKKKNKNIMLGFHYEDLRWIFLQNVKVKIDESDPVVIDAIDVERDTHRGYSHVYITEKFFIFDEIPLIEKIVSAQRVVFRFSGKNGYKDHTLTDPEKLALKYVLETYKNITEP